MDATRAEVERELQRLRNCLHYARKEVEHQRQSLKEIIESDFSAVSVMNGADWLRSKEEDVRLYYYAARILQGILDKTKEPPAGGEVGKSDQ